MKKTILIILATILFLIAMPLSAGGGPQNVALVVNADSWASVAVANEYVRLRGIPANNVIYLEHVPNFETIDIGTFRESILKPVLKIIGDRHLTPQIDYLIYSADLPYAVDTSPETKDLKLPKIFTRTASITGLTYLHERVLAKNPSYLNLTVNRYMRWVKRPDDSPLSVEEQKRATEAFTLLEGKDKKYDVALPILEELSKAHPANYDILYNLACCRARLKKFDEAMAALNAAIDAGWFNAYHTREDEDFAEMRGRQDFKDALAKLEKARVATQPEIAFHASTAWTDKGEPSADGTGEHYLLSTMLAVTSGRGTSVMQALTDLRRSNLADGACPTGTIYFMVNGDVRSKTRRWAFPSAVEQLNKFGVKAETVQGNLPMKKSDVMGAMVGVSDFDFAASGSTILPGAICEHLTSCGGELAQHRSQTECTVFMRAGAAGTSGAVQEPFALQQKFPTPFIHVHYARGCSLAESFYQSVSGPYQLIVVGDPLCAPWARPPTVHLEAEPPGTTARGTLKIHANKWGDVDIGRCEFYVDGVRTGDAVKPGGVFELDTTTYPDGFHRLTVVGIANDRIETQCRESLDTTFDNHAQRITITAPETTLKWDRAFQFTAQLKDAAFIEIVANGRTLARITGESGEAEIPASKLGLGTLDVQARGYLKEGEVAAISTPLEVTVEAAWLPAQEKDAAATKKGLRVQIDDGELKIVEPTRDIHWLAKAGLTKGHRSSIDGQFEVATDDLYQFQIHTPVGLTLEIDGKDQSMPATSDWRYVPLPLKKGAHRLRIKVDATNAEPTLDVRFGGTGTRSIEAEMFQCGEAWK